jgi:hypothetical protein
VAAAIVELDLGARDEILDGLGDQDLARGGETGHAGTDVNGQPGELVPDALAFTSMDAGADLQAELRHAPDDLARARDRSRGPVEAREEPVSGGVDLDPPVALELAAHERVMPLKELAPPAVADFDRRRR